MYLAAYHFSGDPASLVLAHDRLLASWPPDAIDLHVCLSRPDGIVVLDACPSRAVLESFSQSSDFHAALRAAGLPDPRVEALGDVHSVIGATMDPASVNPAAVNPAAVNPASMMAAETAVAR